MYKLISWILALAVTTGCASLVGTMPPVLAQTQSVGQLLNVAGKVEIRRANQSVLKGTLLFQLQAGDLIMVRKAGSAEVVLFKNGARFVLPADSSVRVKSTGLTQVSGPAPKSLPRLSKDFVVWLNTPPKEVTPKILGLLARKTGEGALGPRNPTPNGAVRDRTVILRWAGVVEGERLRLRISKAKSYKNTVLREDLPSTAREFKVPDGVLRPGEDYVWSVTAVHEGDSGQQCHALLRVLLPRERAELERLERETAAARTSDPENPASRLLLAQAYERLGLVADAVATYRAVLQLRPDEEGVQAALKRLAPDSQ